MPTQIRILSLALIAGVLALGAGTATAKTMPSAASMWLHQAAPRGGGESAWRWAGDHPDAGPAADAQSESREPFGFGSALVGSAPVGNGPSELALDPATHTIYVANGNNVNGPNAGGDTVSVIDARRCDAHDVSDCHGPWPTITVGNEPSGIAVDKGTDTVYVANAGDNTVSVFNGATCDALDTSGCGQTPATVPVGPGPLDLFADPDNHTVYVANFDSPPMGTNSSTAVSMIDSSACNANHLAKCPATAPPTVDVANPPDDIDVDRATHTVYVTTLAGWSVFDANTCNATVQSGCGTIGYLSGDPAGPNAGEVDPANDTLYTANFDNTISAFDLRSCDAADLSGCASDTPGTVTFPAGAPYVQFEHDLYLAVDARLHSAYVSFQGDAALVVIDTNVCEAGNLAACATLDPPTIHTGADPEGVMLDPTTQTLYTANEVDNDISVINASRCDAEHTNGCRHPAPSISIPGANGLTADDAVHTTYISTADAVAMVDTQSCNATQFARCAGTPPQFSVGHYPGDIAVDHRTHTVYVANYGAGKSGSVSVIDDHTCNARTQTGCASPAKIPVSAGNPLGIVVDPVTDTIYVGINTRSGPNLIAVFNGSSCNASDVSGCAQAGAVMSVGSSGGAGINIAINDRTNTLYVTNNLGAEPPGEAVYVFDAASCDARHTAGCGQTPAQVAVGDDPAGLAVDPRTNTVYVTRYAEGDYPGSVAIIDGATCNGSDASGCQQAPATTPAGFGAFGIAVDRRTHRVYVANQLDTSVSVINGATCNALDTSGCARPPAEDAVGNYPTALAVDAGVGTAYVSNYDNTVSVIPLQR